jgi:hypothetical protein
VAPEQTPEREAEQLAAVAAIVDLPADEIDVWAVVAVRHSGLSLVVSDMCCRVHTAAMLAISAGDLITDQAAEIHAAGG